jgi:hypothetical protein
MQTEINRLSIADGLIANDLNLLACTLKSCSEQEARNLVDDVFRYAALDISTRDKIAQMTETDIDRLQRYETEHRGTLFDIILKCYETDSITARQHRASDRNSSFRRYFGSVLVFFAACYIVFITWMPIPENNIRFADTILGFLLGTVITTVINFFFGSSSFRKANSSDQEDPPDNGIHEK